MPRRRAAPRLYLDPRRKTWIIRDGALFIRTGCAENERERAEKQLAEYIAQKWRPAGGRNPWIAEILAAYAKEHLPYVKSVRNTGYCLTSLDSWWGDRRVRDITAATCRAYAAERTPAAARRDLEVLRAAIGHYRREHGLTDPPAVILPPRSPSRERWLTRSEAARLLRAARRTPHLARFILLGLYTGSRSAVILGLQWAWIDLGAGIMRRRAPGAAEDERKRTPPVRLGHRILAHLRRWRRLDPPGVVHVCHFEGRRIVRLQQAWATARKRAGLDPSVTPHCLRRTRATWLMQRGVDPWEAAGSLGMSLDVLTRVYGQHHPDFQRRAAEV